MRIDGVSEETDADGEVTSSFEYFRQPEEEFDRGVGTADIKRDGVALSNEMARNLCPFRPLFPCMWRHWLRLMLSTHCSGGRWSS